MKKKEYFATYQDFFGKGSTPEEAIAELQTQIDDNGWGSPTVNQFTLFEVLRKGIAKITVEWE